MSSSETSATPIEPPAQEPTAQEERQEWVFRAIAGTAIILLLWLSYCVRNNGAVPLLLAPLIVGAAITVLRMPRFSGAITVAAHHQDKSPSSSILGPPRKRRNAMKRSFVAPFV